jgi:hypothetical protein
MVGTITLDNNRIHQIIDDFELVIAASVSDDTWRNKYLYCTPQYRDASKINILMMT